MYRGTFRYKGWCETLDLMKSLRMLDDDVKDYSGFTYAGIVAERAGLPVKGLKRESISDERIILEDSAAIQSMEFLGFFSDEILHYEMTTPFDITSDRMIKKNVTCFQVNVIWLYCSILCGPPILTVAGK